MTMDSLSFFVSDLHGKVERYRSLFAKIEEERPAAVFIGGDLLPAPYSRLKSSGYSYKDFFDNFLRLELEGLRAILGADYPRIFVIMGNDDPRMVENEMIAFAEDGLWEYCHFRGVRWGEFTVYGYSCIPPSPFLLKDWERFDVTRFVRPGCISPDEGAFTKPMVQEGDVKPSYPTIEEDLNTLMGEGDLSRAVCLFHSPPHRCTLDRADLDGRRVDDVQVDVHVGSVAIQRFIRRRHPFITLHGHIHESTRLTGQWQEYFPMSERRDVFNVNEGTFAFNGSHDGPELALIRFDAYNPARATRELLE